MPMNQDALSLARGMADATIAREGVLSKAWSYDYGVVWRGMEMLFEQSGERKYFDYIQRGVDSFLCADGSVRGYDMRAYNLDYLCNGRQLLYLYQKTGDGKYMRAASLLREQLRSQPRTTDGGFWHKLCYPQQMWLDGLHMAAPFYLEYTLVTGEEAGVIDDVTKQFLLAYRHTYDAATGLSRHAWDAARAQPWADKQTGQARHAWGRAMGWYMVALVDVLDMLPHAAGDREELLGILRGMAQSVLKYRQGGVWEQVLDCPGRQGNYAESSCSCMFAYALLKGARLGLLPNDVGVAAQVSFDALARRFVAQEPGGALYLKDCCRCAGLGGDPPRDGSFAYYIGEPVIAYDLKGTGAFIQAACEMDRARSNDIS